MHCLGRYLGSTLMSTSEEREKEERGSKGERGKRKEKGKGRGRIKTKEERQGEKEKMIYPPNIMVTSIEQSAGSSSPGTSSTTHPNLFISFVISFLLKKKKEVKKKKNGDYNKRMMGCTFFARVSGGKQYNL